MRTIIKLYLPSLISQTLLHARTAAFTSLRHRDTFNSRYWQPYLGSINLPTTAPSMNRQPSPLSARRKKSNSNPRSAKSRPGTNTNKAKMKQRGGEQTGRSNVGNVHIQDNDSHDDGKLRVAIIGGGIAGLSCAAHLTRHPSSKFIPTVFDTGRLRAGGRCSSRMPGDRPPKGKGGNQSNDRILSRFVVDHAAQIITIPSSTTRDGDDDTFEAFREQVEEWERCGVLKKFPPQSVVDILPNLEMQHQNNKDEKGSELDSSKRSSTQEGQDGFIMKSLNNLNEVGSDLSMYYGVNGMGSIPAAIMCLDIQKENEAENPSPISSPLSQPLFHVEQDTWISPSNGVKFTGSKSKPEWTVKTNGKQLGSFDRVVIAHNGKCADRLMSRTPAKALHSLLRTNFAPTVSASGGKRMTLNSIYSLTIAMEKTASPISPVLGSVVSAFVKNEPNLRFLTCQTRKHDTTINGRRNDDNIEVWTILSSAKFGKKHKAPQENIPKEKVLEVENLMLSSLERSLHLKEGSLHRKLILDSHLQLWGAAVPLNIWSSTTVTSTTTDEGTAEGMTVTSENTNTGFLYDAEHGAGACGDWLLDPSIGGAWESGRRLSCWITQSDAQSMGLPPDGAFSASQSAADSSIGNVR